MWATPTSQRSAPLPALTVNSPVIGSKPTWTVCSKLVGYDILGFESLCDGLDPLILFFSVFFLRSRSSGSVSDELNRREVQSKIPCHSVRCMSLLTLWQRPHVHWRGRVSPITATAITGQTHWRRWRFVLLTGHCCWVLCHWESSSQSVRLHSLLSSGCRTILLLKCGQKRGGHN